MSFWGDKLRDPDCSFCEKGKGQNKSKKPCEFNVHKAFVLY